MKKEKLREVGEGAGQEGTFFKLSRPLKCLHPAESKEKVAAGRYCRVSGAAHAVRETEEGEVECVYVWEGTEQRKMDLQVP